MKTTDFDFHLPDELIAHYPVTPRDASRMLVIGSELSEIKFDQIPILLKPNDLLVFNNSKVIPARLFGKKGEAKIEFLLHRKLSNGNWKTFAKPGKKLKPGDTVNFDNNHTAIIIQKFETGEIEIKFSNESVITEQGHMPLPPYIKREDEQKDKTLYQTVYAKTEGSVAAPTAGLHFTEELISKLPNTAFVTLHVGAGTFQPVKVDDISEHKMHSEWYEISPETEAAITKAKQSGGRVIPVGTTSLRVLESSAGKSGTGDTDIFITPGYKFKVADALITNFHLPKSTLFMLTCAMAGTEKMQTAYAHAIANRFRFYSYGDACFINKLI